MKKDTIAKARRAKDLRLRREFHVTLEQHDAVKKYQFNACAICGRQVTKEGEPLRLAVDHCHTSGLVRGLLCWQCNKGIAIFQDNPSWLYAASEYLDRPPFTVVFGREFYTAPGKVGTKVRKKALAKFNLARERDGKETELQKRTCCSQ